MRSDKQSSNDDKKQNITVEYILKISAYIVTIVAGIYSIIKDFI